MTKKLAFGLIFMIVLVSLFFWVTDSVNYRKEIITFSQPTIVKDVKYLGLGSFQAEFDIKHNGNIVSTSIPIRHSVKVGEAKTYVEYKTKDFLGQERTECPDLR